MKTIPALIGLMALLESSVYAGPGSDMIIKQRAQEIRDQNNVRQGVASPSQPQRPAQGQPATTPTTSATVGPVQQAQAKLRADLAAIKPGVPATPEQKQQIAKDLIALAQGAKPSSQAAAVLADDLASAYALKALPDKERDRMLSDLAAILNPGSIQKPQMDAIYGDLQAIFQVNGQARKDAAKLSDDARAAGADVKNGAAK